MKLRYVELHNTCGAAKMAHEKEISAFLSGALTSKAVRQSYWKPHRHHCVALCVRFKEKGIIELFERLCDRSRIFFRRVNYFICHWFKMGMSEAISKTPKDHCLFACFSGFPNTPAESHLVVLGWFYDLCCVCVPVEIPKKLCNLFVLNDEKVLLK